VLYPITTIWSHYVPSVRFLMLPPMGSPERPNVWSETYAPEASMWEAPFRDLVWELLEHQRDFDIVDDDSLVGARFENGGLCIADESYKALIIPPMDVNDQRSLDRMRAFTQQGGLTIGFHPLPCRSAQQDGDAQTKAATAALFGQDVPLAGQYKVHECGSGKGVVVADSSGLLRALRDLMPPDIVIEPPTRLVFGLHRRRDGRDIYFLSNHAPEHIDLSVALRATGRPEIWDPATGTIEQATGVEQLDEGTRLALSLDAGSGKLIVF